MLVVINMDFVVFIRKFDHYGHLWSMLQFAKLIVFIGDRVSSLLFWEGVE